ncbi:DUF2155 domain-containing protein [Thalassobaculum sp. OXR-137]|uniref:DUF2155 domain-containing protein n=1 Tax=Thalassobaculum sp. OXR-137 TaxID=3100173 RepID=UPI002AC8EFD9|nr:DUF2155 domain-containing protein [Thalassobaculum sp. OXR-137]WPZ34254.1 DUF2155 domain-containing protein [Thalassobaculum sp. OXR-137]
MASDMDRSTFLNTVASAVLAGGLAVVAGAAAAQTAAPEDWRQHDVVVLQGLDKVTARISRFEVAVGQTVRFGTFNIRVETCQDLPPTLPPESAALLHVEDQPPDEQPREIFSGWMFASSPGLHAVEHPVYDVWVASCKSASTDGQSSAPGSN